jgi:hypothetical protein
VSKRALRGALALGLLGAAAAGCRTAKPQAPSAAPAPGTDVVRAYVGEARILIHRGDEQSVAVRKGEALPGDCDVAVVVRSAALDKGAARFSLEMLGRPNAGRAPKCGGATPSGIALGVSGFAADESAESLKAALDAVLQTPEAYLKSKGTAFDLAPGPDEKEVANPDPTASADERSLARKVTVWPKKLLSVDALYHDPTGRIRQESEMEFDAVVGTDGRLHHPHLKAGLGESHETVALRALGLWRFEPARMGDKPVAARLAARLVLRIY